jgi:hypothetical protein
MVVSHHRRRALGLLEEARPDGPPAELRAFVDHLTLFGPAPADGVRT